MRTTSSIINELVAAGLSRDELAARLGVARETVSRWSSGANTPSFETLQRAAAAAGYQLDVHLLGADLKHVALVHDQLDLAPTERLKTLLGQRWPSCRDALRAAATVGELGVLIGPVAAALHGAPQTPGDGRVDLLIEARDREHVSERLLQHGANPDGIERSQATARSERRERWQTDSGMLSVRAHTPTADDMRAIRDRARPTMLDTQVIRIARVEDLATIVQASPWSEDAIYLSGLQAILASGRYSTRHLAEESLQLA